MSDPSRLLEELADATRLNEGPEGVRKVLRAIYRSGPVPIRELARDLGIPVPVVAAVRGELETRGLANLLGRLEHGSATALPFEDGTLDGVLESCVF